MIIDVHAHLFSWDIPSRPYWQDSAKVLAAMFRKPEQLIVDRMPRLWDTTGEKLVADMDTAGIDKAVLLAIDYMPGGISTPFDLEEQHKVYVKAAERYPDRLLVFAGVDPRRPAAVGFVEKAAKEWHVKGIKIHPCCGFYPNEPCAYRLFDRCQELGLVVLTHTGPEIGPMYSKYAQPMYLDEVAKDFPALNIIMAHAGMTGYEEAAMLCSVNPNLYVDLASWQKMYLAFPEADFYQRIKVLLNLGGRNRVMFGSDWPILTRMHVGHTAWTAVFKEARQRAAKFGIEFSQEEVDGILGENAARLLGLKSG
ncbi:MAG: amidohydrolase [Chloroflexi bacterium]|nr:amidohydrolase [Chloroflexota bacterium]